MNRELRELRERTQGVTPFKKLDGLPIAGLVTTFTMQTEDKNTNGADWLAVIARSLTFIC